jgi:hypothetical protein
MDLLSTLLRGQGDQGNSLQSLGQRFGLDENQTASAVSALLPGLTGGLQNQMGSEGGLDALLGSLGGAEGGLQNGNAALGQLLGSKDASRALANQASAQTGVGADVLKQMLPMVAAMLMGSVASSRTNAMQGGAGGGSIVDMLSSALDQNKDGSAMDDIVGMAQKYLRK